ncbi:SusE domain-containing protein [Belliella kenyensis]|uniref:SusE domain-containing protein n=1 Tax=Belliella kenyensis TaxID=1472724 RepID=A0ABV8EHQ9_9BACT|nr:SusE domain-containing protein [Belliella kenyensis]MCH7401890.1 SusE domain-containing protein [Belliella kenyensis]MDN3604390.1 SusE domain-containing protein [Belliella kenyensis]
MRIITKLLFIVFALPLIWSCETIDEPKVITQTGATIASPPSSLVLLSENAEEVIVFNVAPGNFGVEAGKVSYTIQIDAVGNNFAAPVAVGTDTLTTVEVKVSDLNRRAIAKGLDAEVAGNLEFRVLSDPSREGLPNVVGPAVTISVTPYPTQIELPSLRIPGDYQGWNPGNNNTIIYSEESNDVYEGFVHVLSGTGEFKFITGPAWDEFPDYGLGASANSLVAGGGNISIPAGFGTYKVKANLDDLTYELEKVGTWGIIGDATPGGWNTETPMLFDRDENVLKITLNLVVGKFKFRTEDNTWAQNYGASSEAGIAVFDGSDIDITEAGNYTIILDMKTPWEIRYSFTKN